MMYDGYIEMQSDGRLNTNEYMTILSPWLYSAFVGGVIVIFATLLSSFIPNVVVNVFPFV